MKKKHNGKKALTAVGAVVAAGLTPGIIAATPGCMPNQSANAPTTVARRRQRVRRITVARSTGTPPCSLMRAGPLLSVSSRAANPLPSLSMPTVKLQTELY